MAKKSSERERPVQSFLGLPMRWDRQNMFKNFWNKNDDRLFPPKHFGIGWNVNFYALLKTAGLVTPPSAAAPPARKVKSKPSKARPRKK